MARKYAFDLECTTSEPSHAYMASISEVGNHDINKVKIIQSPNGKQHDKTIALIVRDLWRRPKGTVYYVHNLTYDISFILSYIMKNYDENQYKIERALIMPFTKSYITITITLLGKKIVFKDSLVLFSAPLAKVLESYTDLKKGETPIYKNLEDVVIDDYCLEYSKIDALGLGIAIEKRLEIGRGAMTTASGAFKEFKEMINTRFSGNFSNFFTPLQPELDDQIRKAYRGGFTYLNQYFSNKEIKDITVIDVNSMYPAMMKNKVLPYGEPFEIDSGLVETNQLYPLGLQRVYFKSCVLKEGFIPFISMHNGFSGVNVYESIIDESRSDDERTLLLTIEEFELFKRSYNIDGMRLLGGYAFKGRVGFFDEYINKFWEMKLSKNPTIKSLGKLFLNSLYGKFAEGYEKESYNIYYEDKICYELADKEIRPVGYLPMGIFITSYSRQFLIETILSIGVDNYIYSDTDSIHFIKDTLPDDIEIDDDIIGYWSIEGHYKEGYYIRAKKYCLVEEDDRLKIACAGIKKKDINAQITDIKQFRVGTPINTVEFKLGANGRYVRDKVIKI